MMTFGEQSARYTDLTKDASATNLARGKALINEKENEIISMADWSFLDKERTATSVASQQQYRLPADYGRLLEFWTTVSTTRYRPDIVENMEAWTDLNGVSSSSDITTDYTLIEDYLYLYPTPSSTSVTLHLFYKRGAREMSADDYATGTISAVAASRSVTGVGTVWTSSMAGRSIKINGRWYEIESVGSGTTLTLVKASYDTVAGGTYKIGEVSALPGEFHDLLWKGAVADYMDFKGNKNPWRTQYEMRLAVLLKRYGGRQKTSTQVIRRRNRGGEDPNDYPTNLHE